MHLSLQHHLFADAMKGHPVLVSNLFTFEHLLANVTLGVLSWQVGVAVVPVGCAGLGKLSATCHADKMSVITLNAIFHRSRDL